LGAAVSVSAAVTESDWLLFLLQNVLAWMSYVSIACVLGYVICFAVGLGTLLSLRLINTTHILQLFCDFTVLDFAMSAMNFAIQLNM